MRMVRLISFMVLAWLVAGPLGGPASAQQMSFRDTLAAGYTIQAVTALPLELSKEATPGSTTSSVLVTLQKGVSIAVCILNLAGYTALGEHTMSSARACDIRGGDIENFDFAGPSHTSQLGIWRLDQRNGVVSFCFFTKPANSKGNTACNLGSEPVPPAEDAGPFRLVNHRRADDNSVLRVSRSTGAISICYPFTENTTTRVFCTPGVR